MWLKVNNSSVCTAQHFVCVNICVCVCDCFCVSSLSVCGCVATRGSMPVKTHPSMPADTTVCPARQVYWFVLKIQPCSPDLSHPVQLPGGPWNETLLASTSSDGPACSIGAFPDAWRQTFVVCNWSDLFGFLKFGAKITNWEWLMLFVYVWHCYVAFSACSRNYYIKCHHQNNWILG